MVRFLHTADWQLGLKLTFISGERGAWARRERFDVIRRLARIAKERSVDAVIVAGDVFDDNAVGGEILQMARDALATFAPIPVLLLPGNHDAATPDSVFHRLKAGSHVRPLLDNVPFITDKAHYFPCPLRRRHEREDPTQALPQREAGDPVRVAIAHGGLIDFEDGEAKNLIDWRAILSKGFDYVALGDWHGTLNFGPRVYYSGTPEPTRFKEKRPGNALVVTIDEAGAEPVVEVVNVQRTRWVEHEEALEDDDLSPIESWFDGIEERSQTLVSLTLRGQLSLAARANLDARLERESETLMYLRLNLDALHCRPTDADLERVRVEGFVGAAANVLCADGGPVAIDALRVLHRILVEEAS